MTSENGMYINQVKLNEYKIVFNDVFQWTQHITRLMFMNNLMKYVYKCYVHSNLNHSYEEAMKYHQTKQSKK